MEIRGRHVAVILIGLAIIGFILNSQVQHYQGGEIYESANHAYGLLVKGFNVTVVVETVDGKTIKGNLLSVRGSTISIVVNGTTYTVGGPEATKEDIKAKLIRVIYHGKVYLYEVTPLEGTGSEVFSKLLPPQYYSVRYSGRIYIDGNITPIEIGKLKYLADYKTYGSITINHLSSNGAIITANMVPVQYLAKYLGNYTVYTYGLLYVNSDERNLPLRLVEVRSP
ncbi:hypothetical protein [Thermococcus sp. 21S9]|uniref:hypothetical protein n=1 Tax=Thermococcus sp. 21S9 TaxID=1638223 RepID=UPI001439D6FC|nr:hypothetical protein [Thermococcus sp. 21S9]NJE54971.1 hypothetical protein [Thermococcus sp. 21S9]